MMSWVKRKRAVQGGHVGDVGDVLDGGQTPP